MGNSSERNRRTGLEQYLQRSGPLSRAYRELGEERPSPALDQAVISAARSAIAERGSTTAGASGAGQRSTALAATVVLSFALVMRLALEPHSGSRATSGRQQRDAERAHVRDSNLTARANESRSSANRRCAGSTGCRRADGTSTCRGLAATPAPGKAARADPRNRQAHSRGAPARRSEPAIRREARAAIHPCCTYCCEGWVRQRSRREAGRTCCGPRLGHRRTQDSAPRRPVRLSRSPASNLRSNGWKKLRACG